MSEDVFSRYEVVINDEEQYSIWPQGRDVPAGWRTVGRSGSKEECLSYVEEHWTDMRPLSLRLAMNAGAAAFVDDMDADPGQTASDPSHLIGTSSTPPRG